MSRDSPRVHALAMSTIVVARGARVSAATRNETVLFQRETG